MVAIGAPPGRRNTPSTRACFEFARLVCSPLRRAFERPLDEDRALPACAGLRLDMQNPFQLYRRYSAPGPAQHRAPTT